MVSWEWLGKGEDQHVAKMCIDYITWVLIYYPWTLVKPLLKYPLLETLVKILNKFLNGWVNSWLRHKTEWEASHRVGQFGLNRPKSNTDEDGTPSLSFFNLTSLLLSLSSPLTFQFLLHVEKKSSTKCLVVVHIHFTVQNFSFFFGRVGGGKGNSDQRELPRMRK